MNMHDPFLPDGYEPPDPGGRYINPSKLANGQHTFRCLAPPLIGQQGWITITEGGKEKQKNVDLPPDAAVPPGVRDVKHFWWLPVWNYAKGAVAVMQISQNTIQSAIKLYYGMPAWGDPRNYDLVLSRSGAGMDTEYSVAPLPPQPMAPAIAAAWVLAVKEGFDLSRVFKGGRAFPDDEGTSFVPEGGNATDATGTATSREEAINAFADPAADAIKTHRARFFAMLGKAVVLKLYDPLVQVQSAEGKEARRRMLKSLYGGKDMDPSTFTAERWKETADRMAEVVRVNTPPPPGAAGPDDDLQF